MAEPRFDSKQIGSPFKISSLVSRAGTSVVTAYTDNVTTTIQLGGGTANTSTQVRAAAAGTVNIGENTVVQTTNVGSTNGASATTVRSGTGGLNVTATGATLALAATGANVVTVSTNAVERARINNTGQLIVGDDMATTAAFTATYAPGTAVAVYKNAGTDLILTTAASGVSDLPSFACLRARGSLTALSTVIDGDYIGQWAGLGYVGSAGSGYSVFTRLSSEANGALSATSSPGRLVFWTTPVSTVTALQRWEMNSTGALRGLSAGSQITWTTGLGAFTHIVGPTDQNLLIEGANGGAGVGRALTLVGGGSTTGTPGGLNLAGGSATTATAVDDVGSVYISGGFAGGGGSGRAGLIQLFVPNTNGPGKVGGGIFLIAGQNSNGSVGGAAGGPISLLAGNGVSVGDITGGSFTASSGNGFGALPGGLCLIRAGQGGLTAIGGALQFHGGLGGTAAMAGGPVSVFTAAAGSGTTSVERMRLNSDGVLVVGDTTVAPPANTSVFVPVASETNIRMRTASATLGNHAGFVGEKSRGTLASPTAVGGDDTLGQLTGRGYIGATSGYVTMAYVLVGCDGTPTDTSSAPGRVSFHTAPSGSLTVSERWRLDNGGAFMGMSAGSQITWTTGLGAITHIAGPTDQDLAVTPATNRSLLMVHSSTTPSLTIANTGLGTAAFLRGGSTVSGAARWTVEIAEGVTAQAAGVGGGLLFSGRYDGTMNLNGFGSIAGLKSTSVSGNTDGYLSLVTSNAGTMGERWRIESAGHLLAIPDNTYDIGATGATRPRTIYARTSFIAQGATNALTVADGTITQSAGGLTVTATGAILSLDGTTIETSATAITADTGLAISTTTTGVLSLDTGTTGAINVGTGANAKTVTIGNVTGATALVFNAGTGGVDINATGVGGVTIDAGAAGAFSIDGFASSNVSVTGANLNLTTLTTGDVNITPIEGFDVAAGTTVAINSTGGALNFGNDGDAFAINVGTGAAARTITIGNTTGATGIVLNTGSGDITVSDATNFIFNATTGTKFGTATSQKIGFFNAAPVVQQTNVANPTGGATIDAEARTAIDGILSRLETLGLFAA